MSLDHDERTARAAALAQMLSATEPQLQQALTEIDPWREDFREASWQAMQAIGRGLWPGLRKMLSGLGDVARLQQSWAERFSSRVHVGLLYRMGMSLPATQVEARRLHEITLSRWRADDSVRRKSDTASLIDLLMAESPENVCIPNLGQYTDYRGSIRLRYRMASAFEAEATLPAVIEIAAIQTGVTQWQRRAELRRALRSATRGGRRWRKLTLLDFGMLPVRSQQLLVDVSDLWPLVFTKTSARGADLAVRLADIQQERERLDGVLGSLMRCIRDRRLGVVDGLLEQVPDTDLARALCARLRDEPWELRPLQGHVAQREDFGGWVPMSAGALQRLQAWAPAPLPCWWAMSADDVATAISSGQLTQPAGGKARGKAPGNTRGAAPEILPQELAPMRRAWSASQDLTLIRSGHGQFVSSRSPAWDVAPLHEVLPAVLDAQTVHHPLVWRRLQALSDARPWLAVMAQALSSETPDRARSYKELAEAVLRMHANGRWNNRWGTWIVSAYGCEAWGAVEALALADTCPLRDALAMLQAGVQPLVPGVFQAVVARSLARAERLPSRPLQSLKRWLALDPLAALALVSHAGGDWVQRLAVNRSTPLAALDVFMGSPQLPDAVRRAAWRNRLRRTADPSTLQSLAVRMPPGLGRFPGLLQWAVTATKPAGGTEPVAATATATALVLAARRDGARLLQLCDQLGAQVFSQSCEEAIAHLRRQTPAAHRAIRDAAVLELITHLGADSARNLLLALSRCDHRAAPGCKLDATYTRYTIPKRSGGERTISAPHAAVKAVQRAIVDRLLAPLPLHPAACGFVSGRSIVDNAQPHVGQPVVVNADIRNCFGSVGWSLVLGTLRRELGAVLSPHAIGLLVDLCTAEGVVPTGAPTSPALLNLVLRRTDELLHARAERVGARYTRYADDLTFSGDGRAVGLLKLAERVLAPIGLALDPKKTNIFRRGRRQMVTGLVVNDQVAVPRAIRRQLRAAVHHLEQGRACHWHGQPQDAASLQGRLAFVAMTRPEHAAPLQARLRQVRGALAER